MSIFKRKTVDSIVSNIQQAIDDLEVVAQAADANAARLNEQITTLYVALGKEQAEARRAVSVAQKLTDLIA